MNVSAVWRKVTIFACHFVAVFLACHALCAISLIEPVYRAASLVERARAAEWQEPTSSSRDALPEMQEEVQHSEFKALPIYSIVVGQETIHRVVPGDTPAALARRHGASVHTVLRRNAIADPRRLRIGQILIISNRHIVPAPFEDGLVVDLPILRLYWIQKGKVVASFPVAAGRPAWETPPGIYRVTGRRRNPTWYVPPSIQREMQAAGLPVRKRVPPGPDNPLGKYWIQLSAPGIGLHGTNAPWSVGRYATHGCIRLHEEHIERLFHEIPDGTPVAIVADAVRLARTHDGRIYLESFDRNGVWTPSQLKEVLDKRGLTASVSWPAATAALVGRWGVAADITDPQAAPLSPTKAVPPKTSNSPQAPE